MVTKRRRAARSTARARCGDIVGARAAVPQMSRRYPRAHRRVHIGGRRTDPVPGSARAGAGGQDRVDSAVPACDAGAIWATGQAVPGPLSALPLLPSLLPTGRHEATSGRWTRQPWPGYSAPGSRARYRTAAGDTRGRTVHIRALYLSQSAVPDRQAGDASARHAHLFGIAPLVSNLVSSRGDRG